MKYLTIILFALTLSGCVSTALAVSSLALGARAMYCEGTTEMTKESIRKLTEGQKLVYCPAK